jgi:hypothetical protein
MITLTNRETKMPDAFHAINQPDVTTHPELV